MGPVGNKSYRTYRTCKKRGIMREIRVDDVDFEIRGLMRREIKALRAEGINLLALTVDNADAAYDRVFEMVFDEDTVAMIDNLENKVAIAVWQAVIKETFGAFLELGVNGLQRAGDQEKNLSRSGNGTQTDSE